MDSISFGYSCFQNYHTGGLGASFFFAFAQHNIIQYLRRLSFLKLGTGVEEFLEGYQIFWPRFIGYQIFWKNILAVKLLECILD